MVRNWKELSWALIFAAACAVALDYGKDTWRGPGSFKVYLVGSLEDADIQRVFNSFQKAAEKSRLEINGIPVEFELKNDLGNPTVAKRIAQQLVNAPDTLAVIGHVLSQQTKAAIPVYMSATPRIPLIATTETDDNLLSQCQPCSDGFVPLIQMAPTNKAQSESAVKYALEHGRNRFLLVSEVNGENADYIQNLMSDYNGAVKLYGFKGAIKVGEVSMGAPPSKESFQYWKPDCILYAGEREAAMSLIAAVKSFDAPKGITIILPDSSVNRDMTNQYQEDPKPNEIRYTYPSDAYYFRNDLNVFGQDAFALLRDLVSDSDAEPPSITERIHSLIGMHRISDARNNIISHMSHNANRGVVYKGQSGDTYKFFGYQRDGAYFHVWEVKGSAVLDVDNWHAPKG